MFTISGEETVQKRQGFTLIELVITLAVAAILLSLAVPSFRTMLMNNRATADVNELLADINLARSEAVKRGSTVGICRTSAPASNDPCSLGSDWQDGWIVFDDEDGDGQPEADVDILKTHTAIETTNSTTLEGDRNVVQFLASGQVTNTSIGTIRRCDERGFEEAREVIINMAGRARTIRHDPDQSPCDPVNNICSGEC